MLEETRAQRDQGLWFIAHEAAHFWLGQTVSYEYARDSWITEGGADLLAVRAVAETDPDYDPRAAAQPAPSRIASAWRAAASESARERGEHRAYYACGAVFGLVAEAGSGRSFYRFVRAADRSQPRRRRRVARRLAERCSMTQRANPSCAATSRDCSTAALPTPGNSLRICWSVPAWRSTRTDACRVGGDATTGSPTKNCAAVPRAAACSGKVAPHREFSNAHPHTSQRPQGRMPVLQDGATRQHRRAAADQDLEASAAADRRHWRSP